MTFEVKDLFLKGIVGKVTYNEDEDSYQLSTASMDFGLYPIWADFEGKKIKITVEILEDKN